MQFSTWNTIKLQAKMVSRMNFTIIFGELIKGDLMQMFRELHSSDLPLFSLNFGVITLLPKTQDASKIQQYKHICLLNVSFKIFTKVATIRINSVAEDLISSTQTAFMRAVIYLKEWSFSMKQSMCYITKIRVRLFSKETLKRLMKKVQWDFLMQRLRMKGFSPEWIGWITSFISGRSVVINVNGEVGSF